MEEGENRVKGALSSISRPDYHSRYHAPRVNALRLRLFYCVFRIYASSAGHETHPRAGKFNMNLSRISPFLTLRTVEETILTGVFFLCTKGVYFYILLYILFNLLRSLRTVQSDRLWEMFFACRIILWIVSKVICILRRNFLKFQIWNI